MTDIDTDIINNSQNGNVWESFDTWPLSSYNLFCNCDHHIMAMKQMSNEWHSFDTIFANSLPNCTTICRDDPNLSTNVVLIFV